MFARAAQRRHAVGCRVDREALTREGVAYELGDRGLVVHDQRDARGRRASSVVSLRCHGPPIIANAPMSGPPLPLRRYECKMSARQRVQASAVWMVRTRAALRRVAMADARSKAQLSARLRSTTNVAAGRMCFGNRTATSGP